MPKSFLFTHKRYDYEDASEVKVEVVQEEEDDEGDDNPLQDLSRPRQSRDSSGSVSASSSSGGYSEDESYFPNNHHHQHHRPVRHSSIVKFSKNCGRDLTVKLNENKFSIPKEHVHYPAAPKKRRLPTNLTWKELNNNNDDDQIDNSNDFDKSPPQIHIKEESPPPPPLVSSLSLNSSFKSLIVSAASTSPLELSSKERSSPSLIEKKPGSVSTMSSERGNVIQFYQQPHHHLYLSGHSSTPIPDHIIHATQPQNLSYHIKLISPPPGGTFSRPIVRSEQDKLETMTTSPLQYIIAAAEQQQQLQQSEEDERIFIEGSRSEQSQQQHQRHHRHHQLNHQQQPLLESQPTNNQPIHHQHHLHEEQPVNLSIKKVDLFNLTQLAEVSIAAANREMSLRTSSRSSPSLSSSTSTTQCSLPNKIISPKNNSFKPIIPLKITPTNGNETIMLVKSKSSKNVDCKITSDCADESGTSAGENNNYNVQVTNSNYRNKKHKTEKQSGRKEFGKMMMIRKDERMKVSTSVTSLSVADSTCITTSNSLSSSPSARHRCVECGKGFSTLSNLARHRQTHRSLSDASAVKKCPHCDKVYVSMPAFSMHLRTHNQGCKCPYCGKGFSRPWLLQGHIRTHTGEKPFKCGICNKAFADKSNLRAHTQTHSTEKPFVCARCGKPFALKSYLCKHIESSCMKSNRPSGPSTTTSSSNCGVVPNKEHVAINNSSSTSSPVSSSTGGSSPTSTSSSSTSPTNNRDIRSSRCNNTTTSGNSINVTTTVIPSAATTPKVCGSGGSSSSRTLPTRKKKTATLLPKATNSSVSSGFSSHNHNNNDFKSTLKNNDISNTSTPPTFSLPSTTKPNSSFPNKSGSQIHKASLVVSSSSSSSTPKFGRTELLNSSA